MKEPQSAQTTILSWSGGKREIEPQNRGGETLNSQSSNGTEPRATKGNSSSNR
ncbi:hypothetical protein PAL_GLEAN10015640 [Pteropus alecto]|uniref:Uncharacterized protein n=1 Tax=Pteropus alecto TaxID=9402 RepID=L5KK03_PTEAL|nr:hypothetical protein PAL_GLEAN10015640 [Pteropus alecto]